LLKNNFNPLSQGIGQKIKWQKRKLQRRKLQRSQLRERLQKRKERNNISSLSNEKLRDAGFFVYPTKFLTSEFYAPPVLWRGNAKKFGGLVTT